MRPPVEEQDYRLWLEGPVRDYVIRAVWGTAWPSARDTMRALVLASVRGLRVGHRVSTRKGLHKDVPVNYHECLEDSVGNPVSVSVEDHMWGTTSAYVRALAWASVGNPVLVAIRESVCVPVWRSL